MRSDMEAADRLREEAEYLLLRTTPAVRAHEDVRCRHSHSDRRIADLNKIVTDAMEYSRTVNTPAPSS